MVDTLVSNLYAYCISIKYSYMDWGVTDFLPNIRDVGVEEGGRCPFLSLMLLNHEISMRK